MESDLNNLGDTAGDGVTVEAGFRDETFRLRSYQAEMVKESLKANIIVAMDTGAGKTHIALARTAAELELCKPEQLVWFLAPTVTLCEQQFEVFKVNLPQYNIQILSGKDNVDRWTDQSTWDDVLRNVRVVISTHQVLCDALTHAFVRMEKLALIIFDEAHHCTSNHPANRIMADFYIPRVGIDRSVLPKILGLSASPVMKARATKNDLQELERNMNATAKTPKLHRSELIRFVYQPQIQNIIYPLVDLAYTQSPLLDSLFNAFLSYDIMTDPYVLDLLQQHHSGYDRSKQLEKVSIGRDTYCTQQLKGLAEKGKAMQDELGLSPTNWYLDKCLSRFFEAVQTSDDQLFHARESERQHLTKILTNIQHTFPAKSSAVAPDGLSPKVEALINLLEAEAGDGFTGLVFVEQRVWVATLAETLSNHPRIKDSFNISTFTGTSTSTRRKKNIADLVESRNQKNTLDEFRNGAKNLILATSVLEEGIDVSSCNLVICFESPKNLKSFVQRRGRARKSRSKYIIFTPATSTKRSPRSWEELEEEMRRAYLEDRREIEQAEAKEMLEEDCPFRYKVPSTGALLTGDNASQHLHHFCAVVAAGPFVDSRPQFEFHESTVGTITATVTLPISIESSLRKAHSEKSWVTERAAKKDVSFQAYVALHKAGLVNDNLLPAHSVEVEETAEFDQRSSLIQIGPPFDPWIPLAECQAQEPHTYDRVLIMLETTGEQPVYMTLSTACLLPVIPDFPLYWNSTKYYKVTTTPLPRSTYNQDMIRVMRRVTRELLYSVFQRRMPDERYDFLWLLAPCDADGLAWNLPKLQLWLEHITGSQSAIHMTDKVASEWGWISVEGDPRNWMLAERSRATAETGAGQLQLIRAPKRRDFLHPVYQAVAQNSAYTRIELANTQSCTVRKVPLSFSIFALFLPSILSKTENYMIAERLCKDIMRPLSFTAGNLPLIVQAIKSTSTGEEENYERLEFLGDCLLKLIATLHVMAVHPTWPEQFLTSKKEKIVNNKFLTKVNMASSLYRFIIRKRFTGSKWAPRYVNDILDRSHPPQSTQCSSKVLADVVESLIGTSYVLGGLSAAVQCTQTIIHQEPWTTVPEANTALYNAAPSDTIPQDITALETLTGHTFSKPYLLLESLTHGSYTGPITTIRSYERLEFLGDAILDYIVSRRLFAHHPPLPHHTMHSIRTSLVNASILTFLMFENTIPAPPITNKTTFQPEEPTPRALHHYLRHGSQQLVACRDEALAQHDRTRGRILAALECDDRYPWHLLVLNDAPKFLSDIVESILGAVWVDSQGDVEACEGLLGRFGVVGLMERILRDGVDCLHPKERLGILAREKEVRYVSVGAGDGDGDGVGGKKGFTRVQVQVGGEDVGGVVEGVKKLNAETIAAWGACKILEEEMENTMDTDSTGDVSVETRQHDREGEGSEEDESEDDWHDAVE